MKKKTLMTTKMILRISRVVKMKSAKAMSMTEVKAVVMTIVRVAVTVKAVVIVEAAVKETTKAQDTECQSLTIRITH